MPEIESLTARAREISDNLGSWNVLMLWGLALAALAAVMIGISTRLVVVRSGQLSATQDSLRDAKDRQLQSDLRAADARISESKGITEALKIELEEQKQRTARFQQKADEARLALDKQVRLQGPRSRFLQESRSILTERLKLFSGQEGILVVCGASNVIDTEKSGTVSALLNLLSTGVDNAGWKMSLQYDERCIGGESLMVFVHSRASEKTRKAADVLAKQLRVIPFTAGEALFFDPEMPSAIEARKRGFDGERSTLQALHTHPESVVVLIGPRP